MDSGGQFTRGQFIAMANATGYSHLILFAFARHGTNAQADAAMVRSCQICGKVGIAGLEHCQRAGEFMTEVLAAVFFVAALFGEQLSSPVVLVESRLEDFVRFSPIVFYGSSAKCRCPTLIKVVPREYCVQLYQYAICVSAEGLTILLE